MNTLRAAILLAAIPLATAGCMAAAAAAGAGAGIYLTDQGASSLVNGSMATVDANAQAVLREMGVSVTDTKTEDSGREREYRGMLGEDEVHLQVEARSATTTQVTAAVRKSQVEWDKERARAIVAAIVQRS